MYSPYILYVTLVSIRHLLGNPNKIKTECKGAQSSYNVNGINTDGWVGAGIPHNTNPQVVHLNICSIMNKIETFRLDIMNSNLDVITLSEIWHP